MFSVGGLLGDLAKSGSSETMDKFNGDKRQNKVMKSRQNAHKCFAKIVSCTCMTQRKEQKQIKKAKVLLS